MAGKGKPQKYELDDMGRTLILTRYRNGASQIMAYFEARGIPAWRVHHWARALGVARIKDRTWPPEDIAYLKAHWGKQSIRLIAKQLKRSCSAIKNKANRLQLGCSWQRDDGYTLRSLSEAMGCHTSKVQRWLTDGKLKATRSEVSPLIWHITDAEVRAFVKTYPSEVDLARVDKYWFLGLIFDQDA